MKAAIEMDSGGMIYVRTKVHEYRYRHLSCVTVITATVWEPVMLELLIESIYESRRWDGFMLYNIRTKFHEDWYRRSGNIKDLQQQFERL
jgi:hypothetical protein